MPIQSQELLKPTKNSADAVKCSLFAQVVRIHGKARLKAFGTSMMPSIWPGDTLLVERQHISGLAAGDIAVYLRLGRLFAHRVTRIVPGPVLNVITRGDAMPCQDPPLFAHELVGRVTAILPGPRTPGCGQSRRSFRALLAALHPRRLWTRLLQP